MTNTETESFPKIDRPGHWRWVDKHFISDCRQVKLQRRYFGFLWITQAQELYHPFAPFRDTGPYTARRCLRHFQNSKSMTNKQIHSA